MHLFRAVAICALVSMSTMWGAGAFADDKTANDNLLELVKSKSDFKTAWGSMFKGEYSPPIWIDKLEGRSRPVREITIDGKDYVLGMMSKIKDASATGVYAARDRFVVLFSADHKKCWGLERTIPDAVAVNARGHAKELGTLRYYGSPDAQMKEYLLRELDKTPARK